MTTVKCPICKDRVSAENTEGLNASLREHLADVHNMRELTSASREGGMRGAYGTGAYSERESREGMMEREGRRYERERDYPYTERPPSAGFSAPQTRTMREVETWSSRDPERFRPENYIPREEVRQWRYPVTGPYGERGPTTERSREGWQGREERMERPVGRGAGMMATINCPLCGNLVRGADEDDLSDELRDHMSDVHDIRPKMTARFRT